MIKINRIRKMTICIVFAAIILLQTGCSHHLQSKGTDSDLYSGTITNADVLIQMPDLRQYGTYTCGTTCVQMIMNWVAPYEGDINLTVYEEELETTEEAGTPPENMVRYFEKNGIPASAKEKRTIKELAAALDAGHPMIMCIQAWSAADDGGYNTDDPSNQETYLTEGHWVICVGYQKKKSGYVFYFNDPACVGYCMMNDKELDQRWIDMDGAGKVYDHYGIQIEAASSYNPQGVFHLD